MDFWPKLQLTEYEKKFVDYYAESEARSGNTKPGVMRRTYRLQLASVANVTRNIPTVKTIDQIQISRRARVFGITFSGNTDAWRLSVRNTNGTLYTNPTPRTQLYPVVSSLIAGSYYNAMALGGKNYTPQLFGNVASQTSAIGPNFAPGNAAGAQIPSLQGTQNLPWLIEPNWVCQPNETLIFQGEDISPSWATAMDAVTGLATATLRFPQVLNITIFAWEFPGMNF